jgi:hypothetical protein
MSVKMSELREDMVEDGGNGRPLQAGRINEGIEAVMKHVFQSDERLLVAIGSES